MVEVYSLKGLWLWHKHIPSKLWLYYEKSMMKGLRHRRWGCLNDGAYNMIPTYSRAGFDLNYSGGKGCKLNEHLEAREECLKHCVGF